MDEKLTIEILGKEEKTFIQGICHVKIGNRTPCGWNADIIESGVKFFNRDNTDYIDGPRYTVISCHESEDFYSRDDDKCVWQVYVAIKVEVPGLPTEVFQGRKTAPDGKCIIGAEFWLGRKENITEAELKSKNPLKMLEIKFE